MSFYEKYILNGYFGWNNTKWFLTEMLKTWSGQPSYFSRKRIESCLLFTGGFSTLLSFTIIRIKGNATYEEILALTGAMFVYAGYTMSVIQKEKKNKEISKSENEPA